MTMHESAVAPSQRPDMVENLRDRLAESTKGMDPRPFELRGLWDISLRFRPNSSERLFRYAVYMAQTCREGCCYVFGERAQPDSFDMIGMDARVAKTGNHSLDIAILDAAYSAIASEPDQSHLLVGTSAVKARKRAEIVLNEVNNCLSADGYQRPPKIAVIGAIGTIIEALQTRSYSVVTTDLDPSILDTKLHDILVEDGNVKTLSHVHDSDVAVVTGMTIATKTLSDIVDAATSGRTPIVLVAETGAWFAPAYRDLFGIDSIVAEPFPFYIFSGTSEVNVYRKQRL